MSHNGRKLLIVIVGLLAAVLAGFLALRFGAQIPKLSLAGRPLPPDDIARLIAIFGALIACSGLALAAYRTAEPRRFLPALFAVTAAAFAGAAGAHNPIVAIAGAAGALAMLSAGSFLFLRRARR